MGRYRVLVGDITSNSILKGHDLIINPTNPQMVAGAGVSGAIFKKAGVDRLEDYTQKKYDINYFTDYYKEKNIMKIGDVRITPGFDLNIDIMFVQGPKQWEYDNSLELLTNTYKTMLDEIYKKGYKNVLLPSLGTGEYGFEHSVVGKIITSVINEYIQDKDLNIDLVLYDENNKAYY